MLKQFLVCSWGVIGKTTRLRIELFLYNYALEEYAKNFDHLHLQVVNLRSIIVYTLMIETLTVIAVIWEAHYRMELR